MRRLVSCATKIFPKLIWICSWLQPSTSRIYVVRLRVLSNPLEEFPIPYTSLIIQYMPNDLTFPFITSGFFWHIDSLHFDANFTLSGDRNNCKWTMVSLIGLLIHSECFLQIAGRTQTRLRY